MRTAATTEGVLTEETATDDDPLLYVIKFISSGVHNGRLKVFLFIFYIFLLHFYLYSFFYSYLFNLKFRKSCQNNLILSS